MHQQRTASAIAIAYARSVGVVPPWTAGRVEEKQGQLKTDEE